MKVEVLWVAFELTVEVVELFASLALKADLRHVGFDLAVGLVLLSLSWSVRVEVLSLLV